MPPENVAFLCRERFFVRIGFELPSVGRVVRPRSPCGDLVAFGKIGNDADDNHGFPGGVLDFTDDVAGFLALVDDGIDDAGDGVLRFGGSFGFQEGFLRIKIIQR